MDLKEIDNLSLESERKHWWIRTRFNYINLALKQLISQNKNEISILEFGCGSAQNIWYLRTQSKYNNKIQKIYGFDPNLKNDFNFDWQTNNDFLINSLDSIKNKKFDLILAMDVLEHIDNDQEALSKWTQYLKDDGVVLLTVPAFRLLWSYHDQFLEHKRRYTTKMLKQLTISCNLKTISLTYAFSYLFIPVLFIRKIFGNNSSKKSNQDLILPNNLINQILIILGKIEAIFLGCPLFGTSVIGIFKK